MPIPNPPPADELAKHLTPIGTTPKEQPKVPAFEQRSPGVYMQKLIIYKDQPMKPLAQNGAIYTKLHGKTYLVLGTIAAQAIPSSRHGCSATEIAAARQQIGPDLLKYLQSATL